MNNEINKTPVKPSKVKVVIAYLVALVTFFLVAGLINSIAQGIAPFLLGIILGALSANKVVTLITGKPIKKFYFRKPKDEEEAKRMEKRDKKITKITVWILVGVTLLGTLSSILLNSLNTARQKAENNLQGNQTELTYDVIQEIVEETNKGLPEMVDSDTRLNSVSGMENSLTYKYTLINYNLADFKDGANLNDILRDDLVNSVCTTPEMEIFVKNKATLNYSYYDKKGLLIETISIDTGVDCI